MSVAAEGVALDRDGHRTLFKWHRGRRQRDDVPFTAARVLEGLRLGASVEIDLRRHASGGFAVLHDPHLDDETTGTGPVAARTGEALRQLVLRAPDGAVSAHPVLLFEDLCAALAGDHLPPDALLQLDLKEDFADLTAADLDALARAPAPLRRHLILSGGDAPAVRALAAHAPGMAVGYDPCHGDHLARLRATGDHAAFVAAALAEMPEAAMIYLDFRLVLAAAERGFDLIGPFRAAGKRVDAWTLNPDRLDAMAALKTLLDLKADQITTDDPVRLHAMARGLIPTAL